MPSATSVVARSYPDNVIGVDNHLPWHLRTDMRHFRTRTDGHAIIMGRRTYDSLPKRPLPNRLNIVLSREPLEEAENLSWAKDIPTALLLADTYSICNMRKQFFVIGGETIYSQFAKTINKVWLTQVFAGRINGDAKFEFEFTNDEWWTPYESDFPQSEVDQFPFRITCYIRRKPVHRQRSADEFHYSDTLTVAMLDAWRQKYEDALEDLEDPGEQLKLL